MHRQHIAIIGSSDGVTLGILGVLVQTLTLSPSKQDTTKCERVKLRTDTTV